MAVPPLVRRCAGEGAPRPAPDGVRSKYVPRRPTCQRRDGMLTGREPAVVWLVGRALQPLAVDPRPTTMEIERRSVPISDGDRARCERGARGPPVVCRLFVHATSSLDFPHAHPRAEGGRPWISSAC